MNENFQRENGGDSKKKGVLIFSIIILSGILILAFGGFLGSFNIPSGDSVGTSGYAQLISTENSTSCYNTNIFIKISTFSNGYVPNTLIGIQFTASNNMRTIHYNGTLGGNILPVSTNASAASLVNYSNNFGSGSKYVIHFSGPFQISYVNLSLYYSNSVILNFQIK